jgi:SAM-dependent methyltransferase
MLSETLQLGRTIRDARECAFQVHTAPLRYHVRRAMESYSTRLPQFEGKWFREVLSEQIKERSPENPFTVLDLGCGRGNFLLDCAIQWPGKINGIGVTSKFYPNSEISVLSGLNENSQKVIDIKIADIANIDQLVKKSSVDLAVSVQTFRYLADPWMALKKVYSALAPDGICLIDMMPTNFEDQGGERSIDIARGDAFSDYLLSQYGITHYPQYDDAPPITFRKLHDKLSVPLRYTGVFTDDPLSKAAGIYGNSYNVVKYGFDWKRFNPSLTDCSEDEIKGLLCSKTGLDRLLTDTRPLSEQVVFK